MPSPLVQEITANTNGFQAGMKQAEQSLEGFVNSTKKTGRQANELRKALKQSTTEAMNLQKQLSQMSDIELNSDYGRQMQAQFQQAMQAAAEYKDQFQDIQQEINNLASDTKYWDAAKEGIGLVSNGLQGLASVYGLMGGEEKKFQQALVAVNAIESTANTIIGIGNTLQKQSALMVGLRAAKEKLFGAAKTASTAAEVAGTAAITAETTAVGAATTAQWSWNAAMLANPIGLVIAGVAALSAAIYGIVKAFDSQTLAERQQAEALDAINTAYEEQTNKAAELVAKYQELQAKYEECGGSVTKLTEFSKLYGKEIRALGGDTSSLSKITGFFSTEVSSLFVRAAYNRAQALAAEQAMVAQLAKLYAKIGEIQKRLAAGETIDVGDIEALGLDPKKFLNDFKKDFKKESGADDWLAKVFQPSAQDVAFVGKDVSETMSKVLSYAVENNNYKDVFDKARQNAQKEWDKLKKETGAEYMDFNKFNAQWDKNLNLDTKKTKSTKSTKSTQQEQTAIQKLDNEIKKLNNDLSDLGPRTDENAKSVDALIKKINALKEKKLEIMPRNSVADIENFKKAMQDLISTLPQGSEQLAFWKERLIELEETISDTKISLVDTDTVDGMKAVKSECERMLALLPSGHEDIKKYAELWNEVNDKLTDTETHLNNIKNGVDDGSVTAIKQDIAKLQWQLDNKKLTDSERADLEAQIEAKNREIQKMTQTEVVITLPYKADLTFSYKMTPLEQMEEKLKELESQRDIQIQASLLLDGDDLEDALNKIQALKEAVSSLKKEMKSTEIAEDIKNLKKELGDLKLDAFKGVTGVFKDIYSAFTDLPDALDECDNAFEGFFTILDSFTGLFENIMGVIDIFKQIQTAITTLSGASVAASKAMSAAKKDEAMASASAAAAHTAEENSKMGPWGWVIAIGAAVAIMAALMSLMKFAGGGIVGGNRYFGDQNLVRVNSGEMILNKRQQSHLFNMLDSGSFGSGGGGTATVKIKGEDLYIALKNVSKRKGLSGVNTGIK